jgi:predicted component of viral defense system (DUF524 family)
MRAAGDGKLIVPLDAIAPKLFIEFKNSDNRFHISDDFRENNEAKYQFSEGAFYTYQLFENCGNSRIKSDWKLNIDSSLRSIFKPFSKNDSSEGEFAPNTFVGTLSVPLINGDKKAHFTIEVHSSKIDYHDKSNLQNKLGAYRSEYQLMLEEIVEHSIELVMQYNVPVQQAYQTGIEQISEKELYQRFLFMRSLFKNQEFEEAIQKILANPATRWITETEDRDVRGIRRFTAKNIRELTSRANRIPLTKTIYGLDSIPAKISSSRKIESIDTPENRFIKHILDNFKQFCERICMRLELAGLVNEYKEVYRIAQRLDNIVNLPFFKEVKQAISLKINSPVLQRRSGYRELLRAWLRFHLTSQLSWKFDNADDNLFTGGKKDIASLYEYWVFFVLLRTLMEKYGKFSETDTSKWAEGLIVPDRFGLGLTLQEGRTQAFEFEYNSGKRPLIIKFYYNRSFPGGRVFAKNKGAGSYSKSLRPDYTLSIWPVEIGGKPLDQKNAEETESIVHIHFDAKYKVESSFFQEEESIVDHQSMDSNGQSETELDESIASAAVAKREKEEKKGNYKNVDLYKMHAYKDAIRRSGGAYILYPGTGDATTAFQGYHEIIPSVGAFALRPNNQGTASENIKRFIAKVIENLEDVLSQRECMSKSANKVYGLIYNTLDTTIDTLLREIGAQDNPHETYVLIGYCKNNQHKQWIEGSNSVNKMLYNIRFGNGYDVDGKMAAAKFLILYSNRDFEHRQIYRIRSGTAKIVTKAQLETTGYGETQHEAYFLYEIEEIIELDAYVFDRDAAILNEKLNKLQSSYRPFTLSLMELASIRKANA